MDWHERNLRAAIKTCPSGALTGPSPGDWGGRHEMDVSNLIDCFSKAQKWSVSQLPKWADDKSMRKGRWREAGVAEAFIVPTLCVDELLWDGQRLPVAEWVSVSREASTHSSTCTRLARQTQVFLSAFGQRTAKSNMPTGRR